VTKILGLLTYSNC